MTVALLQPLIPHYRDPFIEGITKEISLDIYTYLDQKTINKNNFKNSKIRTEKLASGNIAKKIQVYNFLPLLTNQYDIIILVGEIRSLSTWIVLIHSKLFRKKTIVWGHGISAKNYMQEKKKLSSVRVLFHKLASHVWLYTDKEKAIWKKYLPEKKLTALHNTIEVNIKHINQNIEQLKEIYNIRTKFNLIYCARFGTPHRRVELITGLIDKLDKTKYGLIIIGDGPLKPDFSNYENIYDFGSIYDENVKRELFAISDLYYQPGWVGLSIVEALAYGKPVVTFKRSDIIKHSVEYAYIEHNNNGFTVSSINEVVEIVENLQKNPVELDRLQKNSKDYYKTNLSMEKMVNNALKSIEFVSGNDS